MLVVQKCAKVCKDSKIPLSTTVRRLRPPEEPRGGQIQY